MKNKLFKWLLIGALAMIILPIFINFIAKIDCFTKIVSAQTGDWILFFGSYLGGIITASISFVILFLTIKHNKNQKKIDNKVEEFNKLREELAYRITLLDFMKIGNIALLNKDNYNCEAEILKLNEYHFELTRGFNAFNLIYEHRKEKYIVDFNNKYKGCINKLYNVIEEMTKAISNKDYHKINNIIKSFNDIQKDYVKPVYESAQNWIKEEEKNIKQMNNNI